jgi:multidrug resistance efflux pump
VSSLVYRVSGGTLGLLIVAVIGLAPHQQLLQTSGVEAVVNARVITVRAPVNGEVEAGATRVDFGTSIARGDILFRIANHRADHSRLDDLTRQIEQLEVERPGIAARLGNARALLADLTEQTRLFVEARILQLEARQDELRAELAAAQARNVEARVSLDRITTLAGKGWVPTAQLNRAERDGSIAQELEAAAQKRLQAVSIELAAARRGTFVGSGNNDRPRSMQRVDQLEQQISNLAQTLAEHDQRISRLNRELAKEKAHYIALAAADITAPVAGSIWEILTAPEEQVRLGQDLVRVVDCGGAVVTAIVDKAVYKGLQVGSPAHFHPREGREDLPGTVIRLSDASATPANFAIQPSGLVRGSYHHITVAVPKLAAWRDCPVGLTGRVSFKDGRLEAIAATAPIDP